ncbi:MAG: DUF6240 domain-containing protein [Roseburia sp.]|nr:DUF6240 domain-containing protein [Roseburia sp.]MCM1279320.1 DUF6240 domain-containing protein [Robinsoniella sp.]
MKVNFEGMNQNQNVDNSKITYSAPYTPRMRAQKGFHLDISGTVMDNNAYGGHGKTTEDVMNEVANLDVANMRNYIAIMSNSMSGEDISNLMKDGFQPGSIDVETAVTVVDQIKAKLAEAGIEIAGYTDDISMDKLKKITGNAGYAISIAQKLTEYHVPVTKENVTEAMKEFEKAGKLEELSDGAIKYMVTNGKEPTIDNLYRAQFSAAKNGDIQGTGYFEDDFTGYYGKKADDIHFERLQAQMEKVIEDAGLVVYKDTVNQAKWLVEKGIPLTKDNLLLLNQLKEITFPKEAEEIINSIAAALSEGRQAKDAFLSNKESALKQAVDLKKTVDDLTDEAMEKVFAEGKIFTIKNLKKAMLEISLSATTPGMAYEKKSIESPVFVTAKRQLEEIRLRMTVDANYKLLKSGFSIETAELEQVVEKLKQQEEADQKVLFGQSEEASISEKASLYKEVTQKVTAIQDMPISVIGKVAFTRSVFTLNYVHTQGTVLKNAYENAEKGYEALMTAPRGDLGDSIQKAFGKIKVLLDDLGIEYNDANARAVRILGYNQMEITEENIDAVKSADEALTSVINKMTPAAVLQMIREEVNPLNMNVEQLYDYLKKKETEPSAEMEKYSKYLYKLEKSNGISEEERDAYIGIYRLFRQIEKGDGAAIGSLLQSGRELSLSNLLGETRNRKRSFQATVDDDFGVLSDLNKKGISISDQILGYYKRKADHIFEELSPEKFRTVDITGDVTLEQLDELLSKQTEDDFMEKEYVKEQLDDMRRIRKVGDGVIEALLEYGQDISPDNLLAADYLMNYKGAAFKQIASYAKKNDRNTNRATTSEQTLTARLEGDIGQLKESMTDSGSMETAYDRFIETAEDILENSSFEEGTVAIDVKSMAIFSKQLRLLKNLAKEENYEVPVSIDGQLTSIHIKVLRNKGEKGKVTASLETEKLGKVAACLEAEQDRISGYVVCSSKEGIEILKAQQTRLQEGLLAETDKEAQVQILYSRQIDAEGFSHKKETDTAISTKELYHAAKAFIDFIETC